MDTVTKKYGRRYPWRAWFGRPKTVLRRGVDYESRTSSMAVLVRIAAARPAWKGRVKVSLAVSDDDRELTLHVRRLR